MPSWAHEDWASLKASKRQPAAVQLMISKVGVQFRRTSIQSEDPEHLTLASRYGLGRSEDVMTMAQHAVSVASAGSFDISPLRPSLRHTNVSSKHDG